VPGRKSKGKLLEKDFTNPQPSPCGEGCGDGKETLNNMGCDPCPNKSLA